MSEPQWLTVGKIVNTHGIRGEIKVVSSTDFPEERFEVDNELVMENPETKQHMTIKIAAAREHKGMFILRLSGYNNINEVEKYKGWILKVSKDNLGELDEGEYYHYEIMGCRVVTEDGQELGKIIEILSPGANDVWTVQPPKGKQVLIPVIDDVVLNVDIPAKTVTVRLMEGLI